MSVKIFDTMTTATPNFPLAYAEKINIVKEDGSEDNLQNLFNNGELGGGGDNSVTITEQEYQVLTDEEKYNGLYYCYDVGKIYKNGVEYARSPIVTVVETEDGHNVAIEDVNGVQNFEVLDGKDGVQISDEVSDSTVWSSKKTSDEIAKVETESLANYSIPLNLYMGLNHYLAIKINIHNMNYSFNMSDRSGNIYEGAFFSYNGSFSIQITKVNNSSTKNGYILGFRQYKVSDSEIYLVAKVSDYNYINGVINTPSILKSNIEILVNDDSTLWDKGTDIVVKELATMDKLNYSTTETPIGTWIDGKPIYRKVVDCGALPNKDAKDVSHGIVNIDTVTNIYGIAIGGNISIPLPFADSASDGSVSAYRRGELIRITTATDRTSFTESYITIEYTKTT